MCLARNRIIAKPAFQPIVSAITLDGIITIATKNVFNTRQTVIARRT
jgi:hypothetical protein